MKRERDAPPPRKAPSVIARTVGGMFALLFWVFISLVMSVVVEWVGMTWVWPEEKQQHAATLLKYEQQFLDQRILHARDKISVSIDQHTQAVNQWLAKHINPNTWFSRLTHQSRPSTLSRSLLQVYSRYRHYIDAVPIITQVFFIRIAIILFALPTFVLAGIVGCVDGLVERHLRRWGGGRESSNIYNMARCSVWPIFFMSCVIYISLPITLHPALIIMPSAVLYGLSVRVTIDRLKKYF